MYRLYYESLEQALFFLAPALSEATGEWPDLVKLNRTSAQSEVGVSMARSLAHKDPDFVFSNVTDGIETPLVWGEISTAVETEDHLLQRFDSLRAAAMSDIPYALVHSPRRSASDHGGQTDFDRSMSFRVAWAQWQLPCFDVLWPTTIDGKRARRHPEALACPEGLLGLDQILTHIVERLGTPPNARESALKSDLVWRDASHSSIPLPVPSGRSSRLFQQEDRWVLKFNRWDHAMDPERGMATFWSVALSQPLKGVLHDKTATSIVDALENFSRATGVQVAPSTAAGSLLDVTEDINRSKLSRPGRTIVDCCSDFTVCDADGVPLVTLTWDAAKIDKVKPPFSTSGATRVERKTTVEEDEVTFVLAHRVLPAAGFRIHSVSYPGAQGDFPVLEGSGRSVRRTYFDIIGIRDDLVIIIEAKGSRTKASVQSDVNKLTRWQHPEMKRQIREAIGVSSKGDIVFGVAYPGPNVIKGLDASSMDFQVAVHSDGWHLFRTEGESMPGFPDCGPSDVPDRFRIST